MTRPHDPGQFSFTLRDDDPAYERFHEMFMRDEVFHLSVTPSIDDESALDVEGMMIDECIVSAHPTTVFDGDDEKRHIDTYDVKFTFKALCPEEDRLTDGTTEDDA